jgi:aminopeptidase N
LEAAIAALELYGELYGPCPLAEFDVVEADQWYHGMEWPGLMLLGTVFYDGSDPVCGEWFVAHEVAHQWWYNVVGSDPVAHPWLDEALAQYSAMLYYRRLWLPDAAEAYVQPIIYDRYAPYADRPGGVHLDQPTTAFEDDEAYYAIVYAQGAMFLEALHRALGEAAFFSALQAYHQHNQFQIVTPDTLHATLRQAAPETVDKLWAEWVIPP